ncbi:MAG: hypothetical protein L0Y58_17145 [Verrucomicrobia subdivision 3 bacterium]|nr:hypothetical protein [Limisphaerales bacterium]
MTNSDIPNIPNIPNDEILKEWSFVLCHSLVISHSELVILQINSLEQTERTALERAW